MAEIISYGLIAIGAICMLATIWHFAHTWYKEREWRRNNPDEHEIMHRKIKDDFSD